MLTEKDYCDYDTCVALKELGYNRGAYAYYFPNHKEDLIFNTHQMRGCSINEMVKGYNTYPKDVTGHELIDAPTMYEAQKWLREEKGMLLQTIYLELSDEWICVIRDKNKRYGYSAQKQKNYEEALSEGVKCAVKILKDEAKDK